MTARATCSVCNVAGELYRRDDGGWGLRCACEGRAPRAGAPAAPTAARRAIAPPAGPAFVPAADLRRRTLTLWLPRLPRSDEGPNGREWHARSRAATVWRELVRQALELLGDVRRPLFHQVRIEYVVHHTAARPFDRDNLVVALGKPVQDALVLAGVIPGDGPDVVVRTPDVEQFRSPLPFGFVVVRVHGVVAVRADRS